MEKVTKGMFQGSQATPENGRPVDEPRHR